LDTPDEELPSARFRRAATVYVDCNSFGPRAIEAAVRLYGAERIVCGTDGSAFGVDWTRKALEEAEIGEAARAAILHQNAAAIMARVVKDVAGGKVAAWRRLPLVWRFKSPRHCRGESVSCPLFVGEADSICSGRGFSSLTLSGHWLDRSSATRQLLDFRTIKLDPKDLAGPQVDSSLTKQPV